MKDLNKLCFLPGSLLALKDGKYNYINLLKQGLTNLGVTYPTTAPSLTSTYIGYGSGGVLSGSDKLTWDNSTSDLLIKNGTDSAFRFYRHSGGSNRISMYDGDGNELTLEAGSGYLFASNTDLIITNENDFGNPNLMIEPTSTGNENAFLISGYEGEVFKINKHGWVGIGVTPTVALDVVGGIKVSGAHIDGYVEPSDADYTVLSTDFIINCINWTIDHTITLPGSPVTGRRLKFISGQTNGTIAFNVNIDWVDGTTITLGTPIIGQSSAATTKAYIAEIVWTGIRWQTINTGTN